MNKFAQNVIDFLTPKSKIYGYSKDPDVRRRIRKIERMYSNFSRADKDTLNFIGHKIRKHWLREIRTMQVDGPHIPNLLRTLSEGIIGKGLKPLPVARTNGGDLHEQVNEQIMELWEQWARNPEMTDTFSEFGCQRMINDYKFRDGECFIVHRHGMPGKYSPIPYRYQILETEHVERANGIEYDSYGAPTRYRFTVSEHNGKQKTFTLPANQVIHYAHRIRVTQERGLSPLLPALNEIADLAVLDDAEREAAKLAAVFSLILKKGSPDDYEVMTGAMSEQDKADKEEGVIDVKTGAATELDPGTELEFLESDRPSPNLMQFRQSQKREIAGVAGVSYSRYAREYPGSYSAQRQELIDQQVTDEAFMDELVNFVLRPIYEEVIRMAVMSGLITMRRNLDRSTLYRALWVRPQAQWIDPQKEAEADAISVKWGLMTREQILRRRGLDPAEHERQVMREREIYEIEPENPPGDTSG